MIDHGPPRNREIGARENLVPGTETGGAVNESDFEGSLVLEKLARIDGVDAFMAAVDSDDQDKAVELMKLAAIDEETIHIVLKKMADPYDEH